MTKKMTKEETIITTTTTKSRSKKSTSGGISTHMMLLYVVMTTTTRELPSVLVAFPNFGIWNTRDMEYLVCRHRWKRRVSHPKREEHDVSDSSFLLLLLAIR